MNVAIIGLGNISKYYIEIFNNYPNYKLIAGVDISETPTLIKLRNSGIKTYNSYVALELHEIDMVCILTPPTTHFELVNYFLNKDIIIYCDKILSLDIIEVENVFNLKHKNLHVVYHYKYSSELIFFNNNYKLSEFDEIKISLKDPYYSNNNFEERSLSLGGAWLDSGPNALSLLSTFIDLSKLKLIKQEDKKNNNIDYYHRRKYRYLNKKVVIEITWGKVNNKTTTIKTSKDLIEINHTNQQVIINNNIKFEAKGNRLINHYKNYFSFLNKEIDYKNTLLIHRKLLEEVK